MANQDLIYNVQGPTLVEFNFGEMWEPLGYSDNDDLFSIDCDWRNELLEATDTGREIGEAVYVGKQFTLTGTLTKYNSGQANGDPLTRLFVPPGTTAFVSGIGGAGVIGTTWVSDNYAFGVRYRPLLPNKQVYTFPRCIPNGPASVRSFDHGNTSQKIAFSFEVLRNAEPECYGDGNDPSALYFTRTNTSLV